MDKQTSLLQLDELLGLDAGTLTGSEELSQLESWDSLAMMNFIALASDRDITLSPRQIAKSETVNDLLQLLEAR